MKKIAAALLAGSALVLTGCGTGANDADVVSENLSTAADNFEVYRKVVFFNGITDKYLLEIEGLCSLGNADTPGRLSVTCKDGPNDYKKHFLGLSDNVSFFVQQVEGVPVSAYHYRVTFKPQVIVPDIDLRVSSQDGPQTQN